MEVTPTAVHAASRSAATSTAGGHRHRESWRRPWASGILPLGWKESGTSQWPLVEVLLTEVAVVVKTKGIPFWGTLL